MNIRFIEAFIWVARLKSFRAAAEKLYVSQATISSRIAQLEAEFDCSLFDRKHNDITLTAKGLVLLDNAERVLHATQALKSAMNSDLETTRRLRIGVIESVVHTWFDTFLPTIDLSNPEAIEAVAEAALYWIKEYDLDGCMHDMLSVIITLEILILIAIMKEMNFL